LASLTELAFTIKPNQLKDLADTAESFAVWLIRASVYLEARHAMMGHDEAVKAQNRVAAKVRKALGFSYPKQDINW
jgi:hypothetical protein